MKFFWMIFLSLPALAAPKDFLPVRPNMQGEPRTVMLQLFEWPWEAIGEECERELGPAGYSAVQVSPPQEHIVKSGFWWERYQPVSYQIYSRSGDEAAFRKMVKRCAKAGVDIYADVVLNHMTAQITGSGVGFGGSRFTHYKYGNLWNFEDFHHCRNGNPDDGIRDFTNLYELQNCELLGMADLNTASAFVQEKQASYLNHLLDLGVRGFRIDAAKHIAANDLLEIFGRIKRANYRVLELILSPGEPVTPTEYLPVGDINNFAYAYEVGAAFESGNISRLPEIASKTSIGTDSAVVFLENHDLERRPEAEPILSLHKDPALHKLGMVFLLTWPYGYPAVYSGISFENLDAGAPRDENGFTVSPFGAKGVCKTPFTCVHRTDWMKNLVKFRNATDDSFEATDVWSNGSSIFSFGRGSAAHVVISLDKETRNLALPTKLAPGTYCNMLSDSKKDVCAQVDDQQILRVKVAPKSAFVVLAAGKKLPNSHILKPEK